jgi:hypothetical protein
MVFVGDLWTSYDSTQEFSESSVSARMIARLNKHFFVATEVWGTHFSGKRTRIDAVLTPRDQTFWAGKDVKLGIEFKRGDGSTKEACTHAAQSVDYAHTFFDNFGYMYIFTYPDTARNLIKTNLWFYDRLMGRLGVGQLNENLGILELRLNGHLVWSESSGPVDAKKWKLERKFGSR